MKDVPQQAIFYQQLGENIRTCRKRHNLSQDALAKLVGLTRTSLTNIESGRQHPQLHTFCEIAQYLKVAVSELLPHPLTTTDPVDVKAMVGQQVRGSNELAFIQTGIGIERREELHGDTKKENPSHYRNASN